MQVTGVCNMRAGVRECAGVVCRNVHIACVDVLVVCVRLYTVCV